MSPRRSVPRIRVELLDGSPHNLSPSSTLDIRDILIQIKTWPSLFTEEFVDDPDDALCWGDGCMENIPSFAAGRKPQLFTLHSHRARLPFHIRQEAFELGDFCGDEEDACPLLTTPTIPRMKLVIKEQLYVQKWVDTLTADGPPKHIPWSCEKPAAERKWIAEGSIFPADRIKSEHRAIAQEHSRSCVIDMNRLLASADHVPRPGEPCAIQEVLSAPTNTPTESHTSTSHVPVKSAGVDPGILRESEDSHTRYSVVRTSQAHASPSLLSSGHRTGTTSTNAPLAARRGRSLGGLVLKESVIEQLEYPDIPTAFRGSPSVWSPRFDTLTVPSFTDHQTMLLDLRSKCAALGSDVSSYAPEFLHPQPEMTRVSPNEWMFTWGLAPLDSASGLVDGAAPWDITVDTSIFIPNDISTPAKSLGLNVHTPRFCSRPELQSPVKRFSDPPEDPLPPRPALINPSTPPHVRGILKKVKSVRFEDMVTKEPQETPPIDSPPQAPPERPRQSTVPPGRPCTPMPNTAKLSTGPAPVTEMVPEGDTQKRPTSRSRLPPKRTTGKAKPEPTKPNVCNLPEVSKSTTATTTSVERPCRIAHVKKNPKLTAIHQAPKEPPLSVAKIDVRRGIEGTTKSRLSTPLRNIFRFR